MADTSEWSVIIVDDEPDNLGVIEIVMSFNGVAYRAARSGEECLRLLAEKIPTFMLVDIQMPGMTGYELLEHVRATPAWKHIPAIAVTAFAKPEDEQKIMTAGFDGYISKPVDVLSLISQIRYFLDRRKDEQHD
jgi:CheY-like chemotaxis protein